MKFFSLFVLGIAAFAFNACEKQPYSKLESMESIHHHGAGQGDDHGKKAEDTKAPAPAAH